MNCNAIARFWWGVLLVCLPGLTAAAECRPLETPVTPQTLRAAYSQPGACWPAPQIDAGVRWQELALLPPPPAQSADKVRLGWHLFFDPRLSGSGQIPCAHCHDPDLAWTDGRRHAFGHNRAEGRRNSPTLLNAGLQPHFFWDGRAPTLQVQALEAMTSATEMNADPAVVVERLRQVPGYRQAFRAAFGADPIQINQVTDALAAFVSTLRSRPSGLDRFLQGQYQSLTDTQLQGLHLFRTKARCLNCHHGSQLSDQQFHNIGMHYYGRKYQDLGRFVLTGQREDKGAFKTPGLRDVTLTGPWMHNGLMVNLRGILNFYNRGSFQPQPKPNQPVDPEYPQLSPLMKPLELSRDEVDALLAFLDSLSARPTRIPVPEHFSSQPDE